MASTATLKQISLRVVVDKDKKRVLYAEAEKDFVDVLLSLLTLPLGTIARLVGKDSNMKPFRFGCISSLYESVGNLDHKYFSSETCKKMLLQPRNPMESYSQNLKLNIDDTEPTTYFACESPLCRTVSGLLVSTFKNKKCSCGRNLTFVLRPDKSIIKDYTREGYVQETASFIISDDLNVMPADLNTTLGLRRNLLIKDIPEEFTVNLSPQEVVDLLKCSLFSKTALTDSFLRKEQNLENSKIQQCSSWFKIREGQGKEGRKIKLKVMIAKSKGKILFAQVDENFMNQLLSFLTFPLGTVERILEGNSCLGCIDNLYNSLANFDSTRDFKSEDVKTMLANLGVAAQFKVNNQILPIDEVKYPSHIYLYYPKGNLSSSCLSLTTNRNALFDGKCLEVTMVDPKSPSAGTASCGYAKRPTMFMVADDLSVKPFSSHVALSFLNESNVVDHDLEERISCIGIEEVLGILKASLISSSALTIGLSLFLTIIEQEK